MKLKEVSWKRLNNRFDRACCKLACQARADTIHGGAKAVCLSKRLKAIGSNIPGNEIVSEVYSLSNYTLGRFGAHECPECGNAHLGQETALQCCAPNDDYLPE